MSVAEEAEDQGLLRERRGTLSDRAVSVRMPLMPF